MQRTTTALGALALSLGALLALPATAAAATTSHTAAPAHTAAPTTTRTVADDVCWYEGGLLGGILGTGHWVCYPDPWWDS